MVSCVLPMPQSLGAPAPASPPVSAAEVTAVVVKLSLRGETYRMSFAVDEISWKVIEQKVHNCYDDATRPSLWTLVYRDDENDLVTVSCEREFREAYRVFAELKDRPASHKLHMHFHVVAKLTLKEQLAPVMQVIGEISEKMARIATETRDSLRKSSYVERGRESLYHSAVHTREVLSSAGRGLSQRVRRASSVVAEEMAELPRRLRTRSRGSCRDVKDEGEPSPQVLMTAEVGQDETRDDEAINMDVAVLLAQARAHEVESERLAIEDAVSPQEEVGSPLAEASGEHIYERVAAAEDEAAHEDESPDDASDAETASTTSEDTHDWDVVRASSASSAPPLSPFFEVDVDDENEVSFSRWESQLKTIREIMPHIDIHLCIDVLDKHSGDLEASLVELTEL